MDGSSTAAPSREQLIHALYEAAELEHNLMCTYLYAAFSIKDGEAEGLTVVQGEAVARWRRAVIDVAIEEMGHLAAVWNITSALGGAPRFGRGNFPLDPGLLPAGVVVKLSPFNPDVLQHFIHLERPIGSDEPDGASFDPPRKFSRTNRGEYVTPMPVDYETVGEFYAMLSSGLAAFVARHGESESFCGDPGLQLSPSEVMLGGVKPVICSKTALGAFTAIVEQGEGAPSHSDTSHFHKFCAVRAEYRALLAADPEFKPAHPGAHNPVLRKPPSPEGKVWLDNPEALATVDVANSAYQVMLRLLAYAYGVKGPSPEKSLVVDLAVALMHATTLLGEHAARLPAGQSNPDCNAGMSFTALRDSAMLPPGPAARRFFVERLDELSAGAARLAQSGARRTQEAARLFAALAERARKQVAVLDMPLAPTPPPPAQAPKPKTDGIPIPVMQADGFEDIEGEAMILRFNAKRCIHARNCVTKAPGVFIANIKGPWIHPDHMEVEDLSGILRECPSGALQYVRKDGHPEESKPLVNICAVREGGPYAVRGDLILDGEPIGYRATLCRCGASKNKPFCDGSHLEINFCATGEPATGENTAMLDVRDGPLQINPQPDGPLMMRGNLEITAGTGRMVSRQQAVKLCRCGHSNTKPYCDGTHAKIGFKTT